MKNVTSFALMILIITVSSALSEQNLIQDYIENVEITLLPEKYVDENRIKLASDVTGAACVLYTELINTEDASYFELYKPMDSSYYRIVLPDTIASKVIAVKDFAVNDETLSLLLQNTNLIIFKLTGNDYNPVFVHNDGKFTDTKIIDNFVIAYSNYIYTGTKVLKIDLNDNYKQVSHKFPNRRGIEFTLFQPKQLIDVTDKIIAISNLHNFHIDFFDWDFIKTGSIDFTPESWQTSSKAAEHFASDFKVEITDVNQYFDKLRPLLTEFSMIHRINFISGDRLLVMYSKPNENSLYDFMFAIYKKSGERWRKISDELTNYIPSAGDNMEKLIDEWYIHNTFTEGEETLLQIEPIPFEINEEIHQLSLNKMKKEIGNYYSENMLRYSLVKSELKK